ncbi:MAG TPA: COX15/CtaA family protein [Woeseiaceae bacterium]|nr:COX15/CtaA family protein [Woeseiaceae bacterium]
MIDTSSVIQPSSTLPTPHDKKVATWLLVCCGLVFAMIVLGGVTRLTGSGLSIVDWRPVTGVLPPLSDDKWQAEFAKYQQSPQYIEVNAHMDVHQFKEIYWLEYLHRLLGRLIGVVFLVPFMVFAMRGYIRKKEWPKYLAMFVLGGLQGLLGWYMVKSGLVDRPEVSQYRLTAHLVAALLIYVFMLWVALSILRPRTTNTRNAGFRKAVALTTLIATTIVSGGFVAGLKAGRIFNSFPMMGEYWMPPGVMALMPPWSNFFDNPILVQFNHRVLAGTTLVAVVAFWIWCLRSARPIGDRLAVHLLLGAALLQVTLGISTLLLHVPVALAAIHQAVAVLLLTAAINLVHGLRDAPAASP